MGPGGRWGAGTRDVCANAAGVRPAVSAPTVCTHTFRRCNDTSPTAVCCCPGSLASGNGSTHARPLPCACRRTGLLLPVPTPLPGAAVLSCMCRYGENPHQAAAFYTDLSLAEAGQVGGCGACGLAAAVSMSTSLHWQRRGPLPCAAPAMQVRQQHLPRRLRCKLSHNNGRARTPHIAAAHTTQAGQQSLTALA